MRGFRISETDHRLGSGLSFSGHGAIGLRIWCMEPVKERIRGREGGDVIQGGAIAHHRIWTRADAVFGRRCLSVVGDLGAAAQATDRCRGRFERRPRCDRARTRSRLHGSQRSPPQLSLQCRIWCRAADGRRRTRGGHRSVRRHGGDCDLAHPSCRYISST